MRPTSLRHAEANPDYVIDSAVYWADATVPMLEILRGLTGRLTT